MRHRILTLLLLTSSILSAQEALNNASVTKLVKAGLSEELIVTTINSSAGSYDTTANGLIALKKAGASDKVVAAVVLKASGVTTASTTPANQTPAGTASGSRSGGVVLASGGLP